LKPCEAASLTFKEIAFQGSIMKSWTKGEMLTTGALVINMASWLMRSEAASTQTMFSVYMGITTVLFAAIFWASRSDRKNAEAAARKAASSARTKLDVMCDFAMVTATYPGVLPVIIPPPEQVPLFEELVRDGVLQRATDGRYHLARSNPSGGSSTYGGKSTYS
jgi:hypothetical protein